MSSYRSKNKHRIDRFARGNPICSFDKSVRRCRFNRSYEHSYHTGKNWSNLGASTHPVCEGAVFDSDVIPLCTGRRQLVLHVGQFTLKISVPALWTQIITWRGGGRGRVVLPPRGKALSYVFPLTLAPLGGGAKGPPCGFSQIAPEVLGIRFETCHTSPDNNSTPYVKKLGPRL